MGSSSGGDPRRYGFSCSVCRRKKVRCDGARPTCRNCLKWEVECSYKPETGDLRLIQQLQNANRRVQELEEQVRNLSSTASRSATTIQHGAQLSPRASTSSNDALGVDSTDHINDEDEAQEKALTELSVDENGEVQYFGATSRFYITSQQGVISRDQFPPEHTSESLDDSRRNAWLQSSSRLQKSWERLAFANLQSESDIDPLVASNLLQIYWTWQHPLHNCVYRPCFTRDMALGGPYFSQFLLYTLFAHASRHASPEDPRFHGIERGEKFLAKAKLLLQAEMEQSRPKIPTIQALLILGGRQCAVGKSSEGWLYTGMANRMMKDIGLHLNMRKLAHLEKLAPEDLEVRKRLFLSAYTWDKSISICLGRPPTLTEMPYTPDSLIDHSDDNEMWAPSFLPDTAFYPPRKSFNTQTFINFCRLSQFINETYSIVYNGRHTKAFVQRIINLEERIRAFYISLPHDLRIEDVSLMQFCPPPHIFSLNILYHVSLILLYRPFLFTTTAAQEKNYDFHHRAHKICVNETSKINEFLKAHHRTFNFRIQTYLVSYCVYTAATIDACEIKSQDDAAAAAAAERLSVTLKMLESEARHTPGIKRSIEIIKTQLRTHSEPSEPKQNRLRPEGISSTAHDKADTDQPSSQKFLENSPFNSQTSGVTTRIPGQFFSTHSQASSNIDRPRNINTLNYSELHLFDQLPQNQSFQPLAGNDGRSQFGLAHDANSLQWIDDGIWNSSGGFVPSALNWNMQDMGEDAGFDVNSFWSSMT